ncbi:MAG: dihydrofolate reductase family protein [Candidatus Micrarchaeota archaeon]|nr:dihydrofolate reductase family protein [Candidatus Micrarchaeota archaeon]
MRKIILFIASSLDGFITGENGELDWLFTDQDYGYTKFLSSTDCALMGRKTYETAIKLGDSPKEGRKWYVFTHSSEQNKENITFISDLVPFTKKLRQQKGKNIWLIGGSEAISILMNAGLVDEIIISIHPILLGKGIPLFKNIGKIINLKLVKSTKFNSGLLQLHYLVERN